MQVMILHKREAEESETQRVMRVATSDFASSSPVTMPVEETFIQTKQCGVPATTLVIQGTSLVSSVIYSGAEPDVSFVSEKFLDRIGQHVDPTMQKETRFIRRSGELFGYHRWSELDHGSSKRDSTKLLCGSSVFSLSCVAWNGLSVQS